MRAPATARPDRAAARSALLAAVARACRTKVLPWPTPPSRVTQASAIWTPVRASAYGCAEKLRPKDRASRRLPASVAQDLGQLREMKAVVRLGLCTRRRFTRPAFFPYG